MEWILMNKEWLLPAVLGVGVGLGLGWGLLKVAAKKSSIVWGDAILTMIEIWFKKITGKPY